MLDGGGTYQVDKRDGLVVVAPALSVAASVVFPVPATGMRRLQVLLLVIREEAPPMVTTDAQGEVSTPFTVK